MPRVSVILPAYFSYDTIGTCLSALRQQTYRDFEVIVVNSSAEQSTARAVAAFQEVLFIQSQERLYPHAARNRGVQRAGGELLVFSDPDCVADPAWLFQLVEAWDSGHATVGGAMGLASERWFERGVHMCKFHPYLAGQPGGARWILPTANVAYSRELWRRIGPFDGEIFAGDATMSWRAWSAGVAPWFEPKAIVSHRHAGTAAAFLRQRFHRGAEFGRVRATCEQWSKTRLITRFLATPLLIFIVLCRAARDAGRSGWMGTYISTLPLHAAGHASWAAGEAISYWKLWAKPRVAGKARAAAAQP